MDYLRSKNCSNEFLFCYRDSSLTATVRVIVIVTDMGYLGFQNDSTLLNI